MMKIIALVIVILILGALGFAATKPDSFRYERSISIKAPPEKIFAILNDLHKGALWSPFEKLDPNMKKHFSGAETGVGSVYEWDGNSKAGAGRMEIVESVPSSKIVLTLDFLKPFEGHNKAEFILTQQGENTNVTWAMYGPNPYIGKVMSLVFDCEKMVTREFETGLANLKSLAEKD
jgi:uncharacterized protein YndB with AHSA1/START domain